MKDNKEKKEIKVIKPREVVEVYYNIFKDYEKAYEEVNKNKKTLNKILQDILVKGNSSEEDFKDAAKEYIITNSLYSQEVAFAANKFLNAVDFYMKTVVEDLPENITKDYILVKQQEFKSAFSVKNNTFVRNSKGDIPEMPQEEYDYLFEYLKNQFKAVM